MKYLLDTSVLVNHLRGKSRIPDLFLEEGSSVSIITQAELFYGAYKSERPKHNLSKVKQMVASLGVGIQPLEEGVLERYGKLKAGLEGKGQRLDDFDLLIAATALCFDLILVTGNVKHFSRVPRLKMTKHPA